MRSARTPLLRPISHFTSQSLETHHHHQEMGAAAAGNLPPKPPRPSKSPLLRQVHFEGDDNDHFIKVTTAAEYAAKVQNSSSQPQRPAAPVTSGAPGATLGTTDGDTFTQPTSYPALGHLGPQQAHPNNNLPGGPDQWHTSANPAASVSSCFHGPQPQFQQPPHPHGLFTACSHHTAPNMAYQNTAPPPHGVNFQPPVPDNSNGPMTHVYIPRFDGGIPQQAPFPQNPFAGGGGVSVCSSSFYPSSVLANAPAPSTTHTSMLLPAKAYSYYPGGYLYCYYASLGSSDLRIPSIRLNGLLITFHQFF